MNGSSIDDSTRGLFLEEVSPRTRFLWALVAWLGVAASQPGLVRADGFGHMAFICLGPWALVCCRPGRRAFLMEWLAAAVGLLLLMLWMRHLFAWLVPILALVPALYHALSGLALRRLARRYPLALAAPAAWMLGELLRWTLPPPLSFAWWRLGSFLHDTEWVAGSARVWGVWGLTWICASLGGWFADLWRLRSVAPGQAPPFPSRLVHVLGVGPLVLGIALTVLVPAPATEAGPRVLLVQPGIEQELKKAGASRQQVWADMTTATAAGLAATEEPVDLVCWGETMFPYSLVTPGARAALERGENLPAFTGRTLTLEALADHEQAVEVLLERAFFRGLAPRPDLPEAVRGRPLLDGPAFVTGIRELISHEGDVRSRNAAALWVDGELAGTASKVHLVPAAEDPGIWVELPLIPDVMLRVGGFVPEFVGADVVEVLELPRRSGGEPWRMGATVCYDQIFDDPYAARAGEVDLHLVLSNEAWYRDSLEMDHMVAFARLDAIATGRSVVRATNSGVSCVLDPSGALLDQIEDADGRRKMVAGHLAVQVPVPVRRTWTPWARTYRWQPWLWAALCLAILLTASVTATGAPGSGARDRGSRAEADA